MKKCLLRSIVVLIMFASLLSCSSDSGNDCTPIACLNGGVSNSNCGCNCPQGYSGANCSTPITPVSMTISKIRVTMFPNTDNGVLWDDPLSNADITVILARSGTPPTMLWEAPNYYADVLSNGSNFYDFIPATPIVISQVQASHIVGLYDYDGADPVPSANDVMGALSFPPYIPANGFPSTVHLSNVAGNLKFELTVTYQW